MPPTPLEPNHPRSRPITFAHRGARSEQPENTLPAFRRALELGAAGLESDARLSADGEAVLVHGAVARDGIRRRRRVTQSTAAELAELGVPRLRDLYRELGTDFELSLDLYDVAAAEPVLEVVAAAGAASRLWLCSGRVGTLRRVHELDGHVHLVHSTKRSALGSSVERHADELAQAGIEVCNMRHLEWTAGLVALFHRFDVRAFAWDVQEVRHVRAMLELGIDGIYSDHVDRLVATVAEWSET
ncbi:MAG TPA: glycerophosphodiester phosphodiesterase [Acidimicrobiia bacterium]|nr:glycerophosphodiester phosphodiesterase [Acidimicrobiia bacterium]